MQKLTLKAYIVTLGVILFVHPCLSQNDIAITSANELSAHASIEPVSDPGVHKETYEGREMIVFVPNRLPPVGRRALIVVLHGGMGNAERIESSRSEGALRLDETAEKRQFIVAYLNGTQATRRLGQDMLAWNAGGGCCGQPSVKNIDDVGYITSAVVHLSAEYGIDSRNIFGMGHSNGAMMVQRIICETNLFRAVVAISGPLNLETDTCPAARGKRVLAIHGNEDENVPLVGGRGTKGISGASFKSEADAQQIFTQSGGLYDIMIVRDADHKLDDIEDSIKKIEGKSIAEVAVKFFGFGQ